MAESTSRDIKTQDEAPKVAQKSGTTSSGSGTVHVELIAQHWQEMLEDGNWVRHRQGAILDIPKKLYDELGDESDHFKPAFRKVAKDADN